METNGDQSAKQFPPIKLPAGISEDYIDCRESCGLIWHILKAGDPEKPLVLFCHGYPELAYSWRKVLAQIADAGYYCVAMDQRGYGRTTGMRQSFHEVELNDYVGLSIIGHDFGGVSSAMAALMRPDVFKSTVQLSHPHHSTPTPRLGDQQEKAKLDIQAELAKLNPPRKHYKWYNSTREAALDWDNPPQGLGKFLRGYFHLKSADWTKNDPHALEGWSAQAMAVMPEYYIMQKDDSMPDAVAHNMDGEDYTKTEQWLPQDELQVYCDEWRRTGFQGGLNWYRAQTATTLQSARDMLLYAGRKIEVPCAYIGGRADWGTFQQPGALESYKDAQTVEAGCFRGVTLVDGAGHWVQQEQPEAVTAAVLSFFNTL